MKISTLILSTIVVFLSGSHVFAGLTYESSKDFLASEGTTCQVATDGCNTIRLMNSMLGASTVMFCDTPQVWSCIDDTLEDERIGFLTENGQNKYTSAQAAVGSEISLLLEEKITMYGARILESTSRDTPKSVEKMNLIKNRVNEKMDNLSIKTLADSSMSLQDTYVYNILTIIHAEIQVNTHRRMKNAGLLGDR